MAAPPKPQTAAQTIAFLAVPWPVPADPSAGERLRDQYAELGRIEAGFARRSHGAALLRCLGGNAPYLAAVALREPAVLRALDRLGPDAVVQGALAAIAGLRPTIARARLAQTLRQAKRVVSLATAVADIGGLWTLDQVTAALSGLAEAALRRSVAHLLRAGHDSGELRLPNPADPATGSGFTVLGMGKLGARELNYSSDIDLILLHSPEAGIYRGDSPGAFFSRLARSLVALMEARDADGYVFRTDLRLRPDPAATPPSVALPAALIYYESMAQNWERAAMLKARPVAGDLAMGAEFLVALRPFVWRRRLDFAAVADIHAMKRRIDAHKHTALATVPDSVQRIAGHNVKLGQGGIREIEFLAQTLQLVWGGRDPALRVARTLTALRLLVRAGHLDQRAAAELASAYRFLRRVEHRLQMVNDRQTHTLPEQPAGLRDFALFMGYTDARAFAAVLLRHMERVQARYHELFDAVPGEVAHGPLPPLDFSGPGDPPEATRAVLVAMGYANPDPVVDAVRMWQSGRVRALRSPRSRELMEAVLPGLLAALARQPDPEAVFRRFDAFLSRLPAGVQLLSLFQRNPALVERVAAVLGAAPSLAEHLAITPSALEGLLVPAETASPVRLLRSRLGAATALEDAIGVIRRTVREEDFRISVATLEGRMDVDAAGLARAALADAALAALLPRVLADFAGRNGRVRGGGLAVVLLGKAGGREMMAGSDLDLMLIYDHPETVTESAGVRRMAASQWFIRAVHAYVAALTASDAEGPMYQVDMRLRPSGNKGPVAVSLAGFERYHAAAAPGADTGAGVAGAWTWERMALTRARVVAGPQHLRARLEAAIGTAIAAADPAQAPADARAMRARMLRETPAQGLWDVKHRAGGQIDVEFVAQTLQLVHARRHPEIVSPTTRTALARLAGAGLLSDGDATILMQADRIWRTTQGLLRLTAGPRPPPGAALPGANLPETTLPDATLAALLRVLAPTLPPPPSVDLAGLVATLDDVSHNVRAVFAHLIGEFGG